MRDAVTVIIEYPTHIEMIKVEATFCNGQSFVVYLMACLQDLIFVMVQKIVAGVFTI